MYTPRMAKYDRLQAHLSLDGRDRIEMTFEQVAGVVGGLPKSAYEYSAWWANERGCHVQASGWLDAGYRVELADLMGRRVRFARAR